MVALTLGVAGVTVGSVAWASPGATAAAAKVAAPAPPGCGSSDPTLTVGGTGMATGTPDLLTVLVGIDVTDGTAEAALADNNGRAAALTAVLTAAGVGAADIQTSGLSLEPQYNLAGAVTGYQVTNSLTAKLRDFATAGATIDALAAAAGDSVRIDDIAFSVEDPRKLEDAARTDAVTQAVNHAQAMAAAAGETLGPVCSLSDQTSSQAEEGFAAANEGLSQSGTVPAASAVPLEAGSQQESVQVTMTYALETGKG